jgi:uncharacterized tellurite resistance protein B-like protein
MAELKNSEESNKMLGVLNWAYEIALNGLPGMGTAIELAHDYENEEGSLTDKVNSLIRWQVSKTATSGFLTGVGGLITLPVAVPADLASSIYIQMRMIAAIAHMGGYDVKSDKVKTLIYICLVGESAKDILKDVGIQIGLKTGKKLVTNIPGKLLVKINQMVGFKLATKFGTKGAINLVKIIPVFGGIVGGTINGITTNIIGNYARVTFIKTSAEEPIAVQFVDFAKIIENDPDFELLKFYSYINMIKVDGIRKEAEIQLFKDLIDHSLLDDSYKMKLISKLNSNELEDIDYSPFKNNPVQSTELLQNLILIAKSDGELHATERAFITRIGTMIGFTENDIERFIKETT